MGAEHWGAIVSAICILMAWSYLLKENHVYTFAEHLFIGIVTARGITYTWEVQLKPIIQKDMLEKGKWDLVVPALLGLLIYAWFIKGWQWLARLTMGYWIGYGAGYTLSYTPARYFKQITDSFIELNNFNNIVYFIVLISAVSYFFFTLKKNRGPLKWGSTFGRYALMVAFGSAYGSITMAYLSLIIGKLQIIYKDALHLIK